MIEELGNSEKKKLMDIKYTIYEMGKIYLNWSVSIDAYEILKSSAC